MGVCGEGLGLVVGEEKGGVSVGGIEEVEGGCVLEERGVEERRIRGGRRGEKVGGCGGVWGESERVGYEVGVGEGVGGVDGSGKV